MVRTVLAVILALGGCATAVDLPVPSGVAADDPRVVACREEARQAPEVRLVFRSAWTSTTAEQVRRDADEALLSAYRDCLEREGLSRGGGVEPLREIGVGSRPSAAPGEPRLPRSIPLQVPTPTGF